MEKLGYDVVDEATIPGDIDWPDVPTPQTQADFNASLPHVELGK